MSIEAWPVLPKVAVPPGSVVAPPVLSGTAPFQLLPRL